MPDASTAKNDYIAARPAFLIASDADEAVRRRDLLLERRIDKAPAVYKTALESLGELATQGSIEFDSREDFKATLKRNPRDLLREYFTQRYDSSVEYDDPTEEALEKDENHRRLLDAHKAAQSQHSKETARDAMRYSRLAFFIGRVAAWSEQQAQPASPPADGLRSTG